MPTTSVWFGRLLTLLGIIGYGYGLLNGNASLTALIPAAFGLVLMILGHLAQSQESLRKHLMHAAVIVGLIGFLAATGRIVSKLGEFNFSFAFVTQALMALLCLIFVVLCVRSFIEARRSREA